MLPLFAALALIQQEAPKGCIKDLARLVGGHWEGKLGGATVSHRYESLLDGAMVHDTGSVTQDGKVLLSIDARYGWDAHAGNTYYLDVHNADTVYFGHIVNAGGTFKLHFVNLCKPGDEFNSSFRFKDDDTMEASIDKMKFELKRVKD
jgi:hypothetical protein